MIRAIISDCFGVLYTGSLQTLLGMAPATQRDAMMKIVAQSDYGDLTRSQFNVAIGRLVGMSEQEVEAIITAQRQRDVAMVQYVHELRSRGYATALLSNIGADSIERLFTPDELTMLFDTTVLSYQVRLRKPDPKIYTLTAQRLGVAPGECVMIDDVAENCDGARQTGMQAIHHTDSEQTRRALEALLARRV